MSVRRSQVEPLAAGSRRARTVLEALHHLSLMLAGAQLGITLCSLGLGAVAEPAVAHLLEDALEQVHVPEALLHPIAFAVALTLVVFLHMVLGEMVPEEHRAGRPRAVGAGARPPAGGLRPRGRPGPAPAQRDRQPDPAGFGVEPKDELTTSYSPDELAEIIAESRNEGLLDRDEHERLSSALALQQTCARDVMVTFDRLVTVAETSPPTSSRRSSS